MRAAADALEAAITAYERFHTLMEIQPLPGMVAVQSNAAAESTFTRRSRRSIVKEIPTEKRFEGVSVHDAAFAILEEAGTALSKEEIYSRYRAGGGEAAEVTLGPALSRHPMVESLGKGQFQAIIV